MRSAELRLTRFDDPAAFERRTRDFLLAREAEHNLILGLCGQLKAGDERYPAYYLAVVERNGEVLGAALRTLPYQLVLSHVADSQAIEVVVEDIHGADPDLPGVLGDRAAVRRFAELWSARTGRAAQRTMEQGIYECGRVQAPEGVPGQMRVMTEAERDLGVRWFVAFQAEAIPEDAPGPLPDPGDAIDRRIAEGSLWVWWDDGPVSMAGAGAPTPNGLRIGPVYTPPERRERGYASALTAALTQHLLDGGRSFCFLYTDLANPTSNAIYQRIGYTHVCDVEQHRFGSADI